MARILLVEDNEHIMRINTRYLNGKGHETVAAKCVAEALQVLAQEPVDLIVLDIMLPDGDGVALCERIRAQMDTPILFLTAKSSGADVVKGLKQGGDDYLTKPYDLIVFGARVEALLRRAGRGQTTPLRLGLLTLDPVQGRALWDGTDLCLSGKEFGLLLYLAQHTKAPTPRDELLRAVWGITPDDAGSVLWPAISRLKRKLAPYEPAISLDSSHEGYELHMTGGTP